MLRVRARIGEWEGVNRRAHVRERGGNPAARVGIAWEEDLEPVVRGVATDYLDRIALVQPIQNGGVGVGRGAHAQVVLANRRVHWLRWRGGWRGGRRGRRDDFGDGRRVRWTRARGGGWCRRERQHQVGELATQKQDAGEEQECRVPR